jgi:hypothetical protein
MNILRSRPASLASLVTVAATLGLTACGNGDKAGSPPASLEAATSSAAMQKAAVAALPTGDAKHPLDQYKEWNSNNQVMFSYYGISGMPLDYEKVLNNYSAEYYRTSDEFKKKDIQSALTPRIQQELATAKNDRYIKFRWDNFRLEKYDFQAKAFPQNQLDNDTNFGWTGGGGPNYRITFTNADKFKLLAVPDENQARAIEEKRAKYESMELTVYAFVQDVDPSSMYVKVQIMGVNLADRRGSPLISTF